MNPPEAVQTERFTRSLLESVSLELGGEMNQEGYERVISRIKDSFGQGEELLMDMSASLVKEKDSYDLGALVVSNHRLTYQGLNFFQGSNLSWDLKQVSTLQKKKSLLFEHLEINAGGSHYRFLVQKGTSDPFIAVASKAIENNRAISPSETRQGSPTNPANELEKLVAMFEKGFLTEQEFTTAKAKLLSN